MARRVNAQETVNVGAGFIAQRTCDGAEILTPQTPFGMTRWKLA